MNCVERKLTDDFCVEAALPVLLSKQQASAEPKHTQNSSKKVRKIGLLFIKKMTLSSAFAARDELPNMFPTRKLNVHTDKWNPVGPSVADVLLNPLANGEAAAAHHPTRNVCSASTVRSSRAQSARTNASRVSAVFSTTSSQATRRTIFTPKKSDDPIYSRETPHPHCHSERCCELIESQSGFRLLPAFQGTFGPPPAFEHNADAALPSTWKEAAATTKQKGSSLADKKAEEVQQTHQHLSEFEAQLEFMVQSELTMGDLMAVQSYQQAAVPSSSKPQPVATETSQNNKDIGEASTFSALGTSAPSVVRIKVPAPPSSPRVAHLTAAQPPPTKSQRHAWILKALHDEGKLFRQSSFVKPPESTSSSSPVTVRSRRDTRASQGSALLAAGRPSAVAPSFTQTAVGKPVSEIKCIGLASNFLVALLVKYNSMPSVVMEYKRFVDRHKPQPGVAALTQQTSMRNLIKRRGSSAGSVSVASGHQGRICFMVHHQTGLTLPQFALFLEESTTRDDDEETVISEGPLRTAFHVLADPVSKRLSASDLFATVALSIVPSTIQVNAEHFINLFDPEGCGFVPRTVFHHYFIKKYRLQHSDAGAMPEWVFLEELLRKLLAEKHIVFVYLLNEVISAPMTPLARSRLTLEQSSVDDPAGVFSAHGDSRPLAITVREALCVVYGVQELSDFFAKSTLLSVSNTIKGARAELANSRFPNETKV